MSKGSKIDFFVIGAARCGTTSLYHYLKQHPDIFLPDIKELNHFSQVESLEPGDYEPPKEGVEYHTKILKDFDNYWEQFQKAKAHQKKGDISPSYLWKPKSAQRIYNYNPKAKIIVTLRNPIHRAFSHYLMNVAVGYETHESFKDALEGEKKTIWGGGNLYLEWSSYYEGLKAFIDYFGRENILLLVFEDWIKNKEGMLSELFTFLEVSTEVPIDLEEQFNQKKGYKHLKTLNFFRNPNLKQPLKKLIPQQWIDTLKDFLFQPKEIEETLSPEMQTRLQKEFQEEVRKLDELTGIPLSEKWGFKTPAQS